jgi:ABC-type cobalt transport system substrate-binding protein
MNWRRVVAAVVLALPLWLGAGSFAAESEKWKGVDETVVGKVAREAGRPPSEPWINTERGDLPVFLSLVAGAIGGFIAGYCFRTLFPPKARSEKANV